MSIVETFNISIGSTNFAKIFFFVYQSNANFLLYKSMKFRINFQHLWIFHWNLTLHALKRKEKNSEILAVRITLEMDSLIMDSSLREEKLTHVRT